MKPGKLYFGDNLSVLRDYIAGDSFDLVYLDPPAPCVEVANRGARLGLPT